MNATSKKKKSKNEITQKDLQWAIDNYHLGLELEKKRYQQKLFAFKVFGEYAAIIRKEHRKKYGRRGGI